ncbi:MAG: hypothetical protein ABGZ17_27405 [Planctomycetaceae bacterium]
MQDDWAARYLVESYWFQRYGKPSVADLSDVLRWAQCLADEGLAVPPLGILADLGQLALGRVEIGHDGLDVAVPRWLPLSLLRSYEDCVLGRLWADRDFARGAAAVKSSDRERVSRAVAFLVHRVCVRTCVQGVTINPAVLKRLLAAPMNSVLASGWDALESHAALSQITEQYRKMVTEFSGLGRVLSPADVFELEHHSALSGFSQRLALRQSLELIDRMESHLRVWSPRAVAPSGDVATHAAAESRYPTGGLTALSNRGSIESLLQSQLIYMDEGCDNRPDLFDIKWVRDELLYYTRDEGHFLRPRVTYVIVLSADLAATRILYPDLSAQGILTVLASVVLIVRELLRVMSHISLNVAVFCERSSLAENSLADERELLELLLRDERHAGCVQLHESDTRHISDACGAWSECSHVTKLRISSADGSAHTASSGWSHWVVTPKGPAIRETPPPSNAVETAELNVWDVWTEAVASFLEQPV